MVIGILIQMSRKTFPNTKREAEMVLRARGVEAKGKASREGDIKDAEWQAECVAFRV